MAKKKQPRTPRLDISAPSSVRYAGRLTSVLLAAFLLGLIYLTYVLVTQAPFYMSKAGRAGYGTVYDRKGDVLFDGTRPLRDYPAGHFTDVGTLIGDTSGQITNTLVGQHLGELADYSFLYGANGKAALYTTLSHAVNRTVYDAFGKKDGTVIACNWKTGELLCCVSKPGFDIAKGYADLGNLPEGSLLCKAFSPTVPGSTQKVSTLIAAYECCGIERVNSLKFNCEGSWVNAKNQRINCHKSAGHGEQTLAQAFANSCNPFFAQLVQSPMLPLSQIITTYTHMGYAVNGAEAKSLSLDGIRIAAASTELTDQNDFDTQWGCLGQGKTLVSPYQLMLWQCAVAGGTGRAVQPYLLSARTTAEGKDIPLAETKQTQQMFSASAARAVQTVMTQNAKDHYSSSLGQFACGVKSGTAQVVRDGKETENSLLAGFCLDEKCPVAFCIVIENRRKNELTCAQLAKTLLTSISENLK